jgi:hypothetical protein
MLNEDAIEKGTTSMSGSASEPGALPAAEPFDISGTKDRLAAGTGG